MAFHYHQSLGSCKVIDGKEGIGHGFSHEKLWHSTFCTFYVIAFNDVVPGGCQPILLHCLQVSVEPVAGNGKLLRAGKVNDTLSPGSQEVVYSFVGTCLIIDNYL